jgi:hypothetical protein
MIKSSQLTDLPPPDFPRVLQTWIAQTGLTLKVTPKPLNQYDWPLPTGAPPALQTWSNTIALALTAKPFNQTDWPNPTPFGRDPTLASWGWSYNVNLIGQDAMIRSARVYDLAPPHAVLSQIPLQVMVAGTGFWLTLQAPPPGAHFYDRPQLRPDVTADLYTITHAQQIPQPTPGVTPAVYAKPFLAGPGYLDVIPGQKPS